MRAILSQFMKKSALFEFSLLCVVLISLSVWFNKSFENPVEHDDSLFQRHYWVGNYVEYPSIDFAELVCRAQKKAMSENSSQWCNKNHQEKYWFIYSIKSAVSGQEDVSSKRLNIEMDNHYKNAQQAFKRIFSDKKDSGEVGTNHIPTQTANWLQKEYGVTREGSAPLYCTWWLLDYLEKQVDGTKADISLLKATLIMGIKAEDAPLSGYPSDWQVIKEKSMYCQKSGSPLAVYDKAAASIQDMYLQKKNYAKIVQMIMLSKKAQVLLTVWAIFTYLILSVLRRSPMQTHPVKKLVIFNVLWITNYLLTNYILAYSILPALYFFLLMVVADLLFIASHKKENVSSMESLSPFLYPVFTLFVGMGFFVMIDWSLNGYNSIRYLALYQAQNLYLSFFLLSLMPVLRQSFYDRINSFMESLLKMLRVGVAVLIGKELDKYDKRENKFSLFGKACLFLLVLFFLAGFLLKKPQLTSEIARFVFILAVGFFSVKIVPTKDHQLQMIGFIFLYILTLFFVLAVQIPMQDFGPIMIVIYSMVILLGAKITANKISSVTRLLCGLLIALVSIKILYISFIDVSLLMDRPASRLASMKVPFSGPDDQMALVTYFLASTPNDGYGLGSVPWIGDSRGVPVQTHSDYMPMALYGVLGPWKLVGFYVLYLSWLAVFIQKYRAQLSTEGESSAGRANAFWAWIAVIWSVTILVQLCLTLAGNFGISPLTGISLPLLSFGSVSLLINTAIVGLLLNVTKPALERS